MVGLGRIVNAMHALLALLKNKNVPKGLYVLFATEMWERFNFYGMRALLALYLINALAFAEEDASVIYGGFLGLGYLAGLLGGFVADKYLGNRLCIIIGGLLMAIGQLLLFTSGSLYASEFSLAKILMWVALGIIIIGNGFFKPNISSMVGQLYPKGDSRLDTAFTIFYMGINLGAFLGMTICSLIGDVKIDGVRDVTAFKWGFLSAGIAMVLGVIIFYLLKNKYVVSPEGEAVGAAPNAKVDVAQTHQGLAIPTTRLAFWIILGIVLIFGFQYILHNPEHSTVRQSLDWVYAVIYSGCIALAGIIMSDPSLTKQEKDRIWAIYIVSFFVIFFWACFEQAGSSLTFVADKQTDLYLFGSNFKPLPPSLIQNANSLFIILFAPIFSILWSWMRKRKAEPISPVKQSLGLALLAIGFLVIAFQVKDLGTTGKLGVIWLIVMYWFHTMGELCLSPIGLSLVSKLAPVRFSSLLMGVWFVSSAAGYALAGTLGALIPPTGDKYEKAQAAGIDLQAILEKKAPLTEPLKKQLKDLKIPDEYPSILGIEITNLYEFFMVFVILPGAAAVVLFMLSGLLKRLMHGIR